MARPRKNIIELRTNMQNVHLNNEEKVRIQMKAKAVGMSVSRYLRETGLTSDDTRLPKIRHQMLYEIRKIGVNVNQIAHHVNSAMAIGGFVNSNQLLEQIAKINSELLASLLFLKDKK